jgi:hypothetical protein
MKGLEPDARGLAKGSSFQPVSQIKRASFADSFYLVRMKGLEPSCLAALAPKTSVSTIPPHPLVLPYAYVSFCRLQQKLRLKATVVLSKLKRTSILYMCEELGYFS